MSRSENETPLRLTTDETLRADLEASVVAQLHDQVQQLRGRLDQLTDTVTDLHVTMVETLQALTQHQSRLAGGIDEVLTAIRAAARDHETEEAGYGHGH